MMKRFGVLATCALLTAANAMGAGHVRAEIRDRPFRMATRSSDGYVTLARSLPDEPRYSDSPRCFPHRNRTILAPISIAVFAAPDISQTLLNRVFEEVEAIWGPTGISFDWHLMAPTGVEHTAQLDVTFDEQGGEVDAHPTALGWIPFTADRPEPSIHLSRVRAEAMISGTASFSNIPLFTHENLLGRALGRALSHELGHYFLQSRAHTTHGLMRARWPSGQLLSFSRQGFGLTAEQREAAADYVQLDERKRAESHVGDFPHPAKEGTRRNDESDGREFSERQRDSADSTSHAGRRGGAVRCLAQIGAGHPHVRL